MKVAYFIGSLNRGGTEMLTLDICRCQASAPYEMIIIYRNDGELSEEYRATGVKMIRLKPEKNGYLSYLLAMRSLLKSENVNVLHAQTMTNGLFSVLCTMFTSVKLVSSFHGFFYGFKNLIIRHVVMWGSDVTIYVSNYVRNWYVRHSLVNPEKCVTIYNGIDFSKFDVAYPEPDFLHKTDSVPPIKNNNSERKIRLAMVGNFVSGRSQNVILKSLQLLRERGVNNFVFYFIGKRAESEPWCYDSCVRYANEHNMNGLVFFAGSRGDIPAILQHIDGFVYSTEHDTFGIAVVEAMASGIPVVANDWEVMQEITHNGKWAWLYHTEDIEDAARAIHNLLLNIKEYRQIATKQISAVRNEYSIKKHIKRLYGIYSSII